MSALRTRMALSALVALAAGYLVLEFITLGIRWLWEEVPEHWGGAPTLYVLGLPLIAAVAVYLLRTLLPDAGHSPLAGFAVHPLGAREYLGLILTIIAGLFGGVVLGPEVALVATGAATGTAIAHGRDNASRIIRSGVVGAVLALFIGPLLTGSLNLGKASLEVEQLAWAIPVAAITAGVISVTRWIAAQISRGTNSRPHLMILLVSALVMSGTALTMHITTGESVAYVLTSGEELITSLPTLTSLSTIFIIIGAKALAYAVSLGAGFRGGAFFPAMFIGAAVGLAAALVVPDGPTKAAAIAVGVIAGIVATMRMSWKAVLILGVIVGYAMGGWALIPAAIIGSATARAIPRWEDRVTTP